MKTILLVLLFSTPALAQPQTVYPGGRWVQKKNLPQISYRDNGRDDRYESVDPYEYREFGREVSSIIARMREVATGRERDDLKVLSFRLREYNQAVSDRDWSKADSIRSSLGVQLDRGGAVAADAGRRKAAAARADADRRHREQMAQKDRQHRESMARQRAIEDQLRINNATRLRYRPYYGW